MVPTVHYWLSEPWWETVNSILPNVIGFSLGGYAIIFAFGDTGFRKLLVPPDSNETASTPYASVSAVFLHFILVQLTALIVGVIAKALDFNLGEALEWEALNSDPAVGIIAVFRSSFGALGFFLFLYGISLAAAAALSVFGLSEALEVFLKRKNESGDRD